MVQLRKRDRGLLVSGEAQASSKELQRDVAGTSGRDEQRAMTRAGGRRAAREARSRGRASPALSGTGAVSASGVVRSDREPLAATSLPVSSSASSSTLEPCTSSSNCANPALGTLAWPTKLERQLGLGGSSTSGSRTTSPPLSELLDNSTIYTAEYVREALREVIRL